MAWYCASAEACPDTGTSTSSGWKEKAKMILTKSQLRMIVRESIYEEYSLDEYQNLDEGALDWLQGGLDVVGLIPGVGEAADAVNALISLGRGNPLEALLSAISMVPGAGDAVGKSGKIVLKVLDPAIDLIKRGDDVADIIKAVGPKKFEKIKGTIGPIKDAAAKYGPKVKELLKAVKSKDLDAVEKLGGFKVPKVAREKAQGALDKVAGKLPEGDIDSIFKFLAKVDVGDKVMGTDDYKGEIVSDTGEVLKLAAGRVYIPSLGYAVLGESYTNMKLIYYGNEIKKVIS
jgi:hypothetical protein